MSILLTLAYMVTRILFASASERLTFASVSRTRRANSSHSRSKRLVLSIAAVRLATVELSKFAVRDQDSATCALRRLTCSLISLISEISLLFCSEVYSACALVNWTSRPDNFIALSEVAALTKLSILREATSPSFFEVSALMFFVSASVFA